VSFVKQREEDIQKLFRDSESLTGLMGDVTTDPLGQKAEPAKDDASEGTPALVPLEQSDKAESSARSGHFLAQEEMK
jgi:hypothetical protein